VTLAVGGDCLADLAVLRAEPDLFGRLASDSTVSRTVDRLAADPVTALQAINSARATARAAAWQLAGDRALDHGIARRCTTGRRRRRHPHHRALGEGRRRADVPARVRPPHHRHPRAAPTVRAPPWHAFRPQGEPSSMPAVGSISVCTQPPHSARTWNGGITVDLVVNEPIAQVG
jgi:hypothetical protein